MNKRGAARVTDDSTSQEAARRTDASKLEQEAWAALRNNGGWLTYFQWSDASGIKYASLTPRGKALWMAGRVDREKRPGRNDLGKVVSLYHFRARRR